MANVPKAKKVLFQTALDEIAATDIEGAGTLREDSNGDLYRWVYNNGVTVPVGSPLCANAYTYAAATFYKYGAEAKQAVDCEAFLGLTMSALTTAYYGWVKVLGMYPNYAKVMQNAATGATALPGGQNLIVLTGTATATASGTGTFASGYQALGSDTTHGTAPTVRFGCKLLGTTTATAGGPWSTSVYVNGMH